MQADHEWRPPRSYDDVKGWFYPRDQAIFTWLLDRQERLVHVDASHLWEHVRGDIEAARRHRGGAATSRRRGDIEAARLLLRADGVVVCDDYRSEHTPGVAAAVWNAVANEGLRPICVTGNKFYGMWSDPKPVQDELVEWLRTFNPGLAQYHNVLDHQLVRVCRWNNPPLPKITPLRPPEEEEEPVAVTVPAEPPIRSRSRVRAIARDLLPPVVTRSLRRARSRLRSS